MEKIRICFFSGDITRSGGTERVASIIANELNKDNRYNISFVSLTERRKESFFYLDPEIQRYALYKNEVRGITHILGYINRLKTIVKDNKVEILIDIDGIIDMYSVPVKWITGVKIISWEHFNMYHHPSQKLRKKVRRFAINYVDAIVTLTEQDKKYYQEAFELKCPIQTIYNPIIPSGEDRPYNVKSKIIISVGRLTYQKGFDRLINTAEYIFQSNPQWRWFIYGEGEDKEILEQAIKEKKLTDNVKIMGNVSDINDRYREAGLFVMTSRFEGLPMTLLEAKYCKLPIISFDISTGPRDVILEGRNGYLVRDGDIETLANRINELIEDDEKRMRFSQHALDDTEKFDINNILNCWMNLIEEIRRK